MSDRKENAPFNVNFQAEHKLQFWKSQTFAREVHCQLNASKHKQQDIDPLRSSATKQTQQLRGENYSDQGKTSADAENVCFYDGLWTGIDPCVQKCIIERRKLKDGRGFRRTHCRFGENNTLKFKSTY